ncbi:MAG TPA: trypsin-like peptidase domain-containing protein [Candidatus Hydrogenedentes bacterium]|nr:trypsin-like peptidase domain-containing protein [Candidatus Hydrogenedentota bacterium]HRK34838.1 trypsin-like peptidase domain-containing protein [Candidatus Hydrogenedentota bacterium]
MKRLATTFAACALIAAGCATTGTSTDRAVIQAKNKVAPALVHIRPVKEVFNEGKREEVSVIGSGFIISEDGYIVTNEHVAGESTLVRCVLYNKEEFDAEVVGADKYTDVAVLKLKTDRTNFPKVKLASSQNIESGQTVLALGSPQGLSRSVSMGIISVTDRYLGDRDESIAPYNNWIQTDAAINPGNSGGPLVNIRGEVVGVNARRLGGADNVGFAIPIDTAKQVVDQIIKTGRVTRSTIGVSFQETTSKTDDPKQLGVVIGDVDPLSTGAEAGLVPGDVLVAVDGTPINARFEEDLPEVRKRIADLPVDKEVTLRVQRGSEEKDLVVKTQALSDMRGKQQEIPQWGFTVSELTPNIVRRAQLASNKGVLVSGAQVGAVASNAGLRQGDVILKLDGAEVENLEAFTAIVNQRIEAKTKLVLMQVKRGALTRYVIVKQNEPVAAPAAVNGGNE